MKKWDDFSAASVLTQVDGIWGDLRCRMLYYDSTLLPPVAVYRFRPNGEGECDYWYSIRAVGYWPFAGAVVVDLDKWQHLAEAWIDADGDLHDTWGSRR